jgi:hypothetical protein
MEPPDLSYPSIVFYLGAGLTVGVGIIIMGLAKWGKKFFAGDKGDKGDTGAQGTPSCPYASDHPLMLKFMGESTQDRHDMREFIKAVDGKVEGTSKIVNRVDAKMDLILKSARIKWNGGD